MRKSKPSPRGLALALIMAASVVVSAAQVSRLEPRTHDGYLFLSFELIDILTDEVWEAIRSGLRITFTFDVELRHKHRVWFDQSVQNAVVSATVRYDNLTRRYHVSRTLDGRVDEDRWIDQESTVGRWMTSYRDLRLFRTVNLEPQGDYYVRVNVRTRPRDAWLFLVPWDRGAASARAVLRRQ